MSRGPLTRGRVAIWLAGSALAVVLAVPASAGAQAQTLGNPLTNTTNAQFGCETQWRLVDDGGTGEYRPTASGTPDCTWFHTGGGLVPGNGTITRITIKSGPNPARIRFVVVRTLASPGPGSFCCYYVAETEVAQPAPNAIQSFNVALPVERNTNPNGIITQDNIGMSAVSGTGTLPIHDYGRHNALDPVNPGNNASWTHPRLSSASDTGSGRRPDGSANGFELMMQVTFCPAGQNCAGVQPVDRVAPTLTRPAFGPSVFRVAPGRTPVAARAKRGSKLRFTLSEAADVRIAVQRPAAGRRKGRACVKPTRKLRRAKRCKRWKTVKTMTRKGQGAGPRVVPFSGRIGRTALRRGRYRAAITARDAGGNTSKVATATFRIVR